MTSNAAFHVVADRPNAKQVTLSEDERDAVPGLGGYAVVIWLVLVVGAYYFVGSAASMLGAPQTAYCLAFLASFVTASIVLGSITSRIRSRRIAELEHTRTERARAAELNRVTSEANRLTSLANQSYLSSTTLVTELSDHLTRAGSWLRNAESEFQASAFGPFWDAVENAALDLSHFNNKTRLLASHAKNYYQALNGRQHNFPPFPVQVTTMSDASSTVNEMKRVVRMGQTNFQFANIWEHRRTRAVLIAGFHTLGEAIANLGSVIDSSIYGLKESVSSDVAKLVEEQIRTRESLDNRLVEQNRMLDNIQHRRRPKPSD